MKFKKLIFVWVQIVAVLLLVACGGGGGGGTSDEGITTGIIANAGLDRTVQVGTTVQVDARESVNDPHRIYTFHWEITTKPAGSTATISSSSAMNPVLIPDALGEYILTLVVSDETGASATDTVKITTTAPTVNATNFELIIDIKQPITYTNWEIASAASDADGNELSATVTTQGSYGTFTVHDESIVYYKTIETNATDSGTITISNGTDSTTITVSIDTLYWKQISSRGEFTTAIKSDGTLWAWGSNRHGQLGDGTTIDRKQPTQEVTHANDWKSLSAGNLHTLALKKNGTLFSWGLNQNGQLGHSTGMLLISTPTQEISNASDWKSIATGLVHSVAIKNNGTLFSWGLNSSGQLGDNTRDDTAIPTQENTHSTNWSTVTVGDYYTVALKTNGTLYAWGNNQFGQLGDNTTDHKSVPTQENTNASDWTSISAGWAHTLALKSDGTLWAWGLNSFGQLGIGLYNATQLVPIQENTLSQKWEVISAGTYHSTAIKNNNTLWAWGSNYKYERGDGNNNSLYSPIQIGTDEDWFAIEGSQYNTISLKKDGTLWAWGYNSWGQLGNSKIDSKYIPTKMDEQTTWKQVSVGKSHTLALKNDNTLWAWGSNSYGQLGDNTTQRKFMPTQEHSHATDWVEISTGNGFSAGRKSDGSIWTWGGNRKGQLGQGDYAERIIPTPEITGGTNWIRMCTGDEHTVAIKSDGSIWAWGDNTFGQLGDASNTNRNTPVEEASHTSNWIDVSCGEDFTVARIIDNTVWSWGKNSNGQLGDGTTTNRNFSVGEVTGSQWESISAGYAHTLAIKTDGTLWGWGYDSFGQLGNGESTSSTSSPIQESSHALWAIASAGHRTSLAIRQDNTLWAFGSNEKALLGIEGREIQKSHAPLQIENITGDLANYFTSLSLSENSVALVKPDGTLWVWGTNVYKQLGFEWETITPTRSIDRD